MATTLQTIETIGNNVTAIAKEIADIKENSGSSINENQVKVIVSNIISQSGFQFTDFIKRNIGNRFDFGLPIMYLSGSLNGISKENKVDLIWKYGSTKDGYQEGTCTCKWQGSSSQAYPKKNYTIAKLNPAIDVGYNGTHKKYVLKASFIDHSFARNIISARLWGEIVNSRTGTDAITTKLKNCPNGGAVNGFPVILVINGEYQGVYTLNIPKDDWMQGMGDGEYEAIISNESSPTQTFKSTFENAQFLIDRDLVEYNSKDNVDWIVSSFNNIVNVLSANNNANFKDAISPYFDLQSAIDYYIFSVLIGNGDGIWRNALLSTYDGTKWFYTAYDLDSTFGQFTSGEIYKPVKTHVPTFTSFANVHRLFKLIKDYDTQVLKDRYQELRDNVMSEENILEKFSNFMIDIPRELLIEDAKKWKVLPNTNTNHLAQICNWYRLRCQYMDAEIEAL